ncbi:MAG: outer membrane protein assembly factor BamB [Candidatus Paceibacteria bacterium]|jgi:outer membrane protein assembly factor BamB
MKTRLTLALLLATSPSLLAQSPEGADWPQWRGPQGSGVSVETTWNPTSAADPLWVKPIGLGHSSFAIVGKRVYTLGYDPEAGLDKVYCLDADSGEEHWTFTYESDIWDLAQDGGTQTTPTVVGNALYTSNREGKVFCFDALSGDVRWERDLRLDRELEPPKWGFSASPLCVGDLIIMNLGQVVALDRNSGEDVWATEKNYGIAYSTPAPLEHEGRAYIASLTGDGLAVLGTEDGAELAFHAWVKKPQIYPMTPVVIDDLIFISGGYDRGCTMLQLAEGKLEELWASRVMRNKMSGCVLWDGHLFGFDESILKCIALDGTMRWRKRGLGTGSMSIAGGRMVILDGKGQLIVAEANSEEYVELSRQAVHEGGTSWSTPVLSHGRIYSRSSLGEMVCLDNRSAGGSVSVTAVAGAEDLPAAAELVSRHLEAIGGSEVLGKVKSVRMKGEGESLRNTVSTEPVQLDWAAGKGFSWQDAGGFQVAHDAQLGWQMGGNSAPVILADQALDAIREAGNLQRVFNPASAYSSMQTQALTVFDNRACFEVKAKSSAGHERTIYFEVDSGLFAGHQGEGIPMWTLGSYQKFDGILLPTQWAFYEPTNGEMNSATFDTASVNSPADEDPFAIPSLVQLYLRTPEQIELDNERLTTTHSEILGDWRPESAPESMAPMVFKIAAGFLVLEQPGREASELGEAREDGSVAMIGAEYVVFHPQTDADGKVTAIEIHIGGELDVRLQRPQ